MKQAKLSLTAVALFAAIGGTLAFKANRSSRVFYEYTTAKINGLVTGICDPNHPVEKMLKTTIIGGFVATFSATTAQNVSTCRAQVTFNL